MHVSCRRMPHRSVPTANPICSPGGRHTKPQTRNSIRASAEANGRTREIHGEIGKLGRDFAPRAIRIDTDPAPELERGLLRSSCASLVAVVKTANLRYGN